jgi:RNA polymerase sigma-70 factor, ECF subfamily
MPTIDENTASSFDVFLRAVPESLRHASSETPGVADALGRALASARMAWPAFADDEALAAHLGRCLDVSDVLPDTLDQLHASDLALALACARGDVAAIRAFEDLTFGDLERAWRGRTPSGSDIEDTKQVLRARLYVGGENTPPKILAYAGRGTLRGWMRAVIARETINAFSRARPEVPSDDVLFAALPGTTEDAETERMKALYKPVLREAFVAALVNLPHAEKNLLRYRYAENLSVRQIAAIYAIHRETAGLRIERARAALEAQIRSELVARLHLQEREVSSVVRLALSGLDLTLARAFSGG